MRHGLLAVVGAAIAALVKIKRNREGSRERLLYVLTGLSDIDAVAGRAVDVVTFGIDVGDDDAQSLDFIDALHRCRHLLNLGHVVAICPHELDLVDIVGHDGNDLLLVGIDCRGGYRLHFGHNIIGRRRYHLHLVDPHHRRSDRLHFVDNLHRGSDGLNFGLHIGRFHHDHLLLPHHGRRDGARVVIKGRRRIVLHTVPIDCAATIQ